MQLGKWEENMPILNLREVNLTFQPSRLLNKKSLLLNYPTVLGISALQRACAMGHQDISFISTKNLVEP